MASAYSIYTKEPAPAPPRPPRFRLGNLSPAARKRLAMGGIALLAVALVTASVWGIRAHNKTKLMASLKEPEKIRQAIDTGQISRREAMPLFRDAMEAQFDKRMDEFFALKTLKERNAYLDKQIDEMQARRREWERRAATQPNWRRPATSQATSRPTTRPRNNDPGRQLERAQGGNPVRQAQRAEFMTAMRERMRQRGMQPPNGGGRGGWGGGGMRGGGGGGRGGGPGGGGGR